MTTKLEISFDEARFLMHVLKTHHDSIGAASAIAMIMGMTPNPEIVAKEVEMTQDLGRRLMNLFPDINKPHNLN